jgi:phage gp36-like protein
MSSSYATLPDLYLWGCPAGGLQNFTDTQKQAGLDGAADVIDGYLLDHYTLPLIGPFPPSIRRACAIICAFDLLTTRGYDPATGQSEQISERYTSTIRWLEKIAKGELTPPLVDSTPGGIPGGPVVNQATVNGNFGLVPTTNSSRPSSGLGVSITGAALRGW